MEKCWIVVIKDNEIVAIKKVDCDIDDLAAVEEVWSANNDLVIDAKDIQNPPVFYKMQPGPKPTDVDAVRKDGHHIQTPKRLIPPKTSLGSG